MTKKDDDDDLKGADALREIGLRLGGLFAGVSDALGAAAKAAKAQKDGATARGAASEDDPAGPRDEETTEEIEIQTAQGPVTAKVSYGLRARGLFTGDDAVFSRGRPSARSKAAGRARAEPAAPEPRRAEIELFDEADALVATVELPGVAPGEVQVAIEGASLRVTAEGARRFAAEAEIAPETAARLDADRLQTRLSNGIAEIRIPYATDADAGAPSGDASP